MGVWRDTNGHGGIQNDTERNTEGHRRVQSDTERHVKGMEWYIGNVEGHRRLQSNIEEVQSGTQMGMEEHGEVQVDETLNWSN